MTTSAPAPEEPERQPIENPDEPHPLISEAMKKAALVWLRIAETREMPAWCLWLDGVAYVVSGPGEQPLPGLAEATTCEVIVRSSDNTARILRWPAEVSRLAPGSPEWDTTVSTLAAKRLNATDGPGVTARWADECVVSRLAPSGDPLEAGPTLTAGRLAFAPPPTPAATRTTVPYTAGRRRNRRRQD